MLKKMKKFFVHFCPNIAGKHSGALLIQFGWISRKSEGENLESFHGGGLGILLAGFRFFSVLMFIFVVSFSALNFMCYVL